MVESCEDNEIAFLVKVFIFDTIAHFNSFIARPLYCGLRLIGDPS
jgi:hypothetical protein